MSIFTLAASRSYNPNDNPLTRFKGTVGATSGSTTVTVTGVDLGPILAMQGASGAGRQVRVSGSTLPVGGIFATGNNSSITVSYPYSVTVTASQANDWLWWSFADAPNEKQFPISYVITSGAFTLDYMDTDGTRATMTSAGAATGVNEMVISVARTLAGTTGSIFGYSKGSSN